MLVGAVLQSTLLDPLTAPGSLAQQLCPENVKGILRGRKLTTTFFFQIVLKSIDRETVRVTSHMEKF